MATLKQLVDETTKIKNELKTCHANLKNNLIEKGVDCNSSDKLLSLANKVGEIELGKKWVSGSTSSSGNRTLFRKWNDDSDYNAYYITIPLSFKPSYVIVTYKGERKRWKEDDISVVSGDFKACAGFYDSYATDDEHPLRASSEGLSFSTEKGFDNGNGAYNIPVSTNSYKRTFEWIAFE